MRVRAAISLVLLTLWTGQGWADELTPELRILLEGFAAHRRFASGYLRTNNPDLGAMEIERLRARWFKDKSNLPKDMTSEPALATALSETEALVSRSLAAVDEGDVGEARVLLEQAASPLRSWRQTKGIRLFSDCIVEASAVYERFDIYRTRTPNLEDTATAGDVIAAAAAAAVAYRRCDSEAPAEIRSEEEFRRLLDGMLDSLHRVPDAVRERDGAYLYRLLIEQRSLERLLAFRFG